MFPKQFKTQQYYDILKQICPELDTCPPGALKSQRYSLGQASAASWSHLHSSPPGICLVFPGTPSASAPTTPRLPELSTVIVVDERLPGTLLLEDVVAAGSSELQLAHLHYTQKFLSCHDPINVLFTSVGPVP